MHFVIRNTLHVALLSFCIQFARSQNSSLYLSTEVYAVEDFGAVGDGITVDTDAIQQAIAKCSTTGGFVGFQSGKTYLTGTLTLTSNAILRIAEGATLLASTRREDYPVDKRGWYLIVAEKCSNCGIEGEGKIDGQADKWVIGEIPGDRKIVQNWEDPACEVAAECRPGLVAILESQMVSIEGITLYNSVYWTLHIFESDTITVRGITIWGDPDIPNNDGIDVDGSQHIYIADCSIDTADDAISVKTTTGNKAATSLLVENCILRSKSSAVKIGSESRANFAELMFRGLSIPEAHRGLAIQLRDSGSVLDAEFENITMTTRYFNRTWWGAAEPIYVTAIPRTDKTKVGSITNVRFTNITATSENGIFVSGCPESSVDSLSFEGVSLELVKTTKFLGGYRDYRPSQVGNLGILDGATAALVLEHVNHVTVKSTKVVLGDPARPEWMGPLGINPHTVHSMSLEGFMVHDELAHPHTAGEDENGIASGLASAHKAVVGMVGWAAALRKSNHFVSYQDIAADGVQGRRAPSSASGTLLVFTAMILVVVVVAGILSYVSSARGELALQGYNKKSTQIPNRHKAFQ